MSFTVKNMILILRLLSHREQLKLYMLPSLLLLILEDEVIMFEPVYDSYLPAITLNGGITKFIQLKFPDYSVDWDLVRDTITDKTRLIIIN